MSLNWPKAGINFAPAYQVSGIPYVTASVEGELTTSQNVVKVDFPFVTSTIRVECSGSASGLTQIRVGFTENGVKGTPTENYFLIGSNAGLTFATPALPFRCKEIYLMKDTGAGNNVGFIVSAGLTNIETSQLGTMTGSVDGTLIPLFEGVG